MILEWFRLPLASLSSAKYSRLSWHYVCTDDVTGWLAGSSSFHQHTHLPALQWHGHVVAASRSSSNFRIGDEPVVKFAKRLKIEFFLILRRDCIEVETPRSS